MSKRTKKADAKVTVDSPDKLGPKASKVWEGFHNVLDSFHKSQTKFAAKLAELLLGMEADNVYLKQTAIAEFCGCDQSYISKVNTAIKKAKAAKIPVSKIPAKIRELGILEFIAKFNPPKTRAPQQTKGGKKGGKGTAKGEMDALLVDVSAAPLDDVLKGVVNMLDGLNKRVTDADAEDVSIELVEMLTMQMAELHEWTDSVIAHHIGQLQKTGTDNG